MNQILYNEFASEYNSTRNADPYITSRLFELMFPKEEGLYIDIGCGTGNYSIQLAQTGIRIYGIDPSEEMLKKAKEKSGSVKWLLGTAEKIPTPNQFFNGGIATLTIHHWTNLETSFAELFRVLKPEARLVIFTSSPEQMAGYWLNHYFPAMMVLAINKMPSLFSIRKAAEKAGFLLDYTEKYSIQPDLKDHFLYSGKLNPKIYLDKNIRMGISSFTSPSNSLEIEEGLLRLEMDTTNNDFEKVQSTFENKSGDYLFVVLEKKR